MVCLKRNGTAVVINGMEEPCLQSIPFPLFNVVLYCIIYLLKNFYPKVALAGIFSAVEKQSLKRFLKI